MSNNIRLLVGGFECTQWDAVSIDSDLMIPADAWSLTLFNPPSDPLPPSVKVGEIAQVIIGDRGVLFGVVDRISDSVNKSGHRLSLSGRDIVGVLLDNSADIRVQQKTNLYKYYEENIRYAFKNFEIDISIPKGVAISNLNKIAIQPSESMWDVIVKCAESDGHYVWARADGTIVIGNPFAQPQPKTPRLVLMRGSNQNNVLSADYTDDITSQYSIVTVLGQDNDTGASLEASDTATDAIVAAQATATDSSVDTPEYTGTSKQRLPYLRRKIVLDTLADNNEQAAKRARKIMQDGNLSAHSLNVEVAGWTCPTGEVWATGWTVHYQSDVTRKAANGQWVIMGRTLKLGRDGRTTQLRLKRKQDWMQPVAPSAKHTDEQSYPTEVGG